MINLFPKNIKECDDTIDKLLRENRKLQKEIAQLNEIINKAIEYIKWNLDKNEELIEYFNYDGNFNELLNILKGEDKND